MISPRPWTFVVFDHSIRNSDHNHILERDGEGEWRISKQDDGFHAVACVNAFHDSGIDPADLPKIIDGFRWAMNYAMHKCPQHNKNLGYYYCCGCDTQCETSINFPHKDNCLFLRYAACLPENK